jgi:glycosyltransferase involved in cell wall biosynthesis
VQENQLNHSVYFTGDVQNVHEYLQTSDIFVFPTENDAFPLSLIEAMACGLPVISTHIGGIKDILKHRQNGLVVKPGDFQELYGALDLMIADDALLTSLGKAARQTIQDKYSTDIVTKKYIEMFRCVSNT